ncbi:MAG: zinc-binding dehydrogenase [Roseiflexaceae bacterium]
MRALVYEGPWQMPLRQIEPPAPGPTDVVVAVQAVGVCGSDVHGFMGTTGRRKPPIVMGHEFSGVIRAVGEQVAGHRAGERVVVHPLQTCGSCPACRAGRPNICVNRKGLGISMDGAYAESVRVPQQMLYALPDAMSWEQGALVEPLAVAMHAVNLTPIALMDTLVIIGAGTIGLLALVCARRRGAGTIIMTDRSPHRLATAQRLGADVVVNIAEQDPLALVQAHTGGLGAHAVIEAVGATPAVKQSLAVVCNGGHVTWIGNSQPEVEINMQQIVTRELTVRGAYCFDEEFGRSIELIRRSDTFDITQLIEVVAPLDEGPQLVHDLAKGSLEAVKVILKP